MVTKRTTAKKSRFFIRPDGSKIRVAARLADVYRTTLEASLIKASMHRLELFTRTASRLALRVHDLRGAFITYALANGKTETYVSDRTGHGSSVMINRYRRVARTVVESRLGDLIQLGQGLPEVAAATLRADVAAESENSGRKSDVSVLEETRRAEVAEWQTQRIQNPPSLRV